MMPDHHTPFCPLPGIGPCVGERCNFWDEKSGCQGTGVAFGTDPTSEPLTGADREDAE
jgi:hypothetical protein